MARIFEAFDFVEQRLDGLAFATLALLLRPAALLVSCAASRFLAKAFIALSLGFNCYVERNKDLSKAVLDALGFCIVPLAPVGTSK